MNISKLEIQNNLLRKEIHNAQFERIKLLKRTNEVKNSCHQLVWEGAKDKVDAKSRLNDN
jgi:FtsZ-binding cell division protein ZapB